MTNIGVGPFHIRLLVVCGFGFSAAAVEIVIMAFLFPELRSFWQVNEYELGMLPAVVGAGSIAGEYLWGWCADRCGRRPIFMGTLVIAVIFAIASAFAWNFRVMCLLRFCCGFGLGGNIAVDFVMFSELLPTRGRGSLLFGISAFWPLGQFLTCLIAWAVIPSMGWRAFVVACAVPSLITCCFRPLVPESPRYLLLNGRVEEATEVCQHIATFNGLSLEEVGLHEGVVLTLENESSHLTPVTRDEKSFYRLFSPGIWNTTLGCLFFTAGLGYAGFGASTFMPSLLQMKGIPEMGVYYSMTLSSLAQFPGVFLAAISSSYVGRRPCIVASLLLVSLALAMFAVVGRFSLIVACSCLAQGCLEFGWSLFHVYLPEVYPTEFRATACGFISATGSVLSSAAPMVSAMALDVWGSEEGVIYTFSLVCASCGLAAAMFLHVETVDRDLTDRVDLAAVK